MPSATILDRIVSAKQIEVSAAKDLRPEAEVRAAALDAAPARDFLAALQKPGRIRLIAEVKKASPSKGIIREDFQPVEIARTYEQHGADCLSVLTDEQFFQGSLSFLQEIREAVAIPVLRKDFILDPYQIYEARSVGADAILLIAECLNNHQLRELYELTCELGMTALVEIYDPANLTRVIDFGVQLIGINNRDLRTFQTNLDHTLQLRSQVPADRVLVAESGIRSHADVVKLQQAGVHAMLVGESLMASGDIGHAVDQLLGG